MLTYLKHEAIDYNKWDTCITKAPNGIIYGLSWYLDIVAPGWHAIVKQDQDEYVTVMPIPVDRKFGMLYVQRPIFAQQLGVFHVKDITRKEWLQVYDLLLSNVRLISSYSFNTENQEVITGTLPFTEQKLFTTYHLDLNQEYTSIVSGYRKDRRWRINKAKRSGLRIKAISDINVLLALFDEHVAPKIAGVIGEAYEYRMLRELYKETQNRGMSKLYAAVDEHQQVKATGVFFLFKKKIIFMLSASTPESKEKGGISLLVDHVLHEYAGQDLVFDFESPEVEHLADFYSSFGPSKAHFVSVSLNDLPVPIKLLKALRMRWYQRNNKSNSGAVDN